MGPRLFFLKVVARYLTAAQLKACFRALISSTWKICWLLHEHSEWILYSSLGNCSKTGLTVSSYTEMHQVAVCVFVPSLEYFYIFSKTCTLQVSLKLVVWNTSLWSEEQPLNFNFRISNLIGWSKIVLELSGNTLYYSSVKVL